MINEISLLLVSTFIQTANDEWSAASEQTRNTVFVFIYMHKRPFLINAKFKLGLVP